MKFLRTSICSDIKTLCESVEGNADKSYHIHGIFMQADRENQNGRIYPSNVLFEEVKRYSEKMIPRRSMGELGHPDTPAINLDRVSHVIKELYIEDSNIFGKAKILNTEKGKIVKAMIDEEIQLGVSSRGVGSVIKKGNSNVIQDDFQLSTVDIVSDPSAQDAFVEGIMEGREWTLKHGIFVEKEFQKARKIIKKAVGPSQIQEAKFIVFSHFLKKLSNS